MIRVLLYGDVDLNLIDGSAIWLASLAEVLGGADDVSLTVLQKAPIHRDLVLRGLAGLSSVTFLDPWAARPALSDVGALVAGGRVKRLMPSQAAEAIRLLDARAPYDVVIVRCLETAETLAERPDLGRRVWAYVTDPMRHTAPESRACLQRIAANCGRVLCQTEEAKAAFLALLDGEASEKLLLLPPMIPAVTPGKGPALDPAAPRLGYSGKFSPPYMLFEMLDAFEKIREASPGAEFHIVGDKFHNDPPVKGFTENLQRRFTTTPGVVWHGGVSRDESIAVMGAVDVASSWRDTSFDDSLELSTKILEYAALGIPVLMNPNPVQQRVFGSDYPGYVTTGTEFVERFLALTSSPEAYRRVSQSVRSLAAEFTYESCRGRLLPPLRECAGRNAPQVWPAAKPPQPGGARPCRLLFAGHDLKFVREFLRCFSANPAYEVRVDEWKGHNIRGANTGDEGLAWADAIFCEWCLGNAKWYSERKRPGQRLLIRLHHQEMGLPFRRELQWSNVDALIFTNFTHYNAFRHEQPECADKALVVFCDVNCPAFAQEKLPGTEFNLGLVGMNPMRKRLDLALEILARLRQTDSRYTLFVKTRMPWEYRWLWERSTERDYYTRLLGSIEKGPHRDSVVFDTHGDDMPLWFSKVGFILSTSDHEGSHQAVAEGMASGCIPVIRDWAGVTPLYPARFVFSSVEEAVERIGGFRRPQVYGELSADAAGYARRYFDTPAIVQEIEQLVQGADLHAPGFAAMDMLRSLDSQSGDRRDG